MLVSISRAAATLSVCTKTLWGWNARSWLVPFRTAGNHGWYDLEALFEYKEGKPYDPKTQTQTGNAAIYCRGSSHSQKEDLVRQEEILAETARRDGFYLLTYKDIGSGFNGNQKGLPNFLADPLDGRLDRDKVTN